MLWSTLHSCSVFPHRLFPINTSRIGDISEVKATRRNTINTPCRAACVCEWAVEKTRVEFFFSFSKWSVYFWENISNFELRAKCQACFPLCVSHSSGARSTASSKYMEIKTMENCFHDEVQPYSTTLQVQRIPSFPMRFYNLHLYLRWHYECHYTIKISLLPIFENC